MSAYTRISHIQLMFLMTGFFIGSATILNQSVTALQDAWLAIILGFGAGIALVSMYVSISMLNPGKSLIEILMDRLGHFFGTIIAIFYIWYFIHVAALVARNFAEFMVTTTYAETPIVFITMSIILVIAFMVRHGLEVIARTSELLVPILIISFIFIFLIVANLYEVENFLPFYERGYKPILQASFNILTFPVGEGVVFMMLFPYLYHKGLLKISNLALLIAGLLILSVTVRDLMVLGPELMARVIFPPHITTALIPNLDITPLVEINLIIGGGTKIAVFLYAAALGIAQLLNLRDHKPFVIPVSVITIVLSVWVFDSILEVIQWASEVFPYYSIPFQFIIPAVLLIISWLKKRPSSCHHS